MNCKLGDLAVFQACPREDLLGIFVEVVQFEPIVSSVVGQPCWLVRVLGPAVLSDAGTPTREGWTEDRWLKPIRPGPQAEAHERAIDQEVSCTIQ